MNHDRNKGWQRMTRQMHYRFERRAWRQYLKTGVWPRNLATALRPCGVYAPGRRITRKGFEHIFPILASISRFEPEDDMDGQED